MFQDTQGKYHHINKVLYQKTITLEDKKGSLLSERIHKHKICFVLSRKTLSLFNCETLEELISLLREKARSSLCSWEYQQYYNPVCIDINCLYEEFSRGFDYVDLKALSANEKEVFGVLKYYLYVISNMVGSYKGYKGDFSSIRELKVGVSDEADGWTDGKRYIAINRKVLKRGYTGFEGWQYINNLLLHEYCHDTNDTDRHRHSFEFYEMYHDLSFCKTFIENTKNMMKLYISRLKKKGKRVNSRLLKSFDTM